MLIFVFLITSAIVHTVILAHAPMGKRLPCTGARELRMGWAMQPQALSIDETLALQRCFQ